MRANKVTENIGYPGQPNRISLNASKSTTVNFGPPKRHYLT